MKACAVAWGPRGGGTQVAAWVGAAEVGWTMTRVLVRPRTLWRPHPRIARWGNPHDETTSPPPREEATRWRCWSNVAAGWMSTRPRWSRACAGRARGDVAPPRCGRLAR